VGYSFRAISLPNSTQKKYIFKGRTHRYAPTLILNF